MVDVTVIVPAFNAAATLAETLASISNQTMPPEAIVVVDDGSTDETTVVARATPGVTLIQQDNAGVAAAMNAGLAGVRTEAVAILDADDVFTPQRLARQSAILAADSALMGVIGETEEFVCPGLEPAIAARLVPRPRQAMWLNGAALLRMQAFRRAGMFDPALRIGAWVDWIDRARRLEMRFVIDSELALRRRLRPGTLSASQNRDASFLEIARRALARRRSEQE